MQSLVGFAPRIASTRAGCLDGRAHLPRLRIRHSRPVPSSLSVGFGEKDGLRRRRFYEGKNRGRNTPGLPNSQPKDPSHVRQRSPDSEPSKANAAKSKGAFHPGRQGKTSRANSYKHGLTATKLFPRARGRRGPALCRVLRRVEALRRGRLRPDPPRRHALGPDGTVRRAREGHAHRAGPPRRDRFRASGGVDEAPKPSGSARKRAKRALFDDLKEAILAAGSMLRPRPRRGFFRALGKLRQLREGAEGRPGTRCSRTNWVRFCPSEMTDEEFERLEAEFGVPTPQEGLPIGSNRTISRA